MSTIRVFKCNKNPDLDAINYYAPMHVMVHVNLYESISKLSKYWNLEDYIPAIEREKYFLYH